MDLIVTCPHCNEPVAIAELNCRIFRHGLIRGGMPIMPHASKAQCEAFLAAGLVVSGCAKPFYVRGDGAETKAEICDYI